MTDHISKESPVPAVAYIGQLDVDPITLSAVIDAELERNWVSIPLETRAVLTGASAILKHMGSSASFLAMVCAAAAKLFDVRKRGGRPLGSTSLGTDFILGLLKKNPGAKPAQIVDLILELSDDDQCVFTLDGTGPDLIFDSERGEVIDKNQLAVRVSKIRNRYANKKDRANLPKTISETSRQVR